MNLFAYIDAIVNRGEPTHPLVETTARLGKVFCIKAPTTFERGITFNVSVNCGGQNREIVRVRSPGMRKRDRAQLIYPLRQGTDPQPVHVYIPENVRSHQRFIVRVHGQEYLIRAPPFSSSGSSMHLPQCSNKRIDTQRERLFGLVRSFRNNEFSLLHVDEIDWDSVREMIAQNFPNHVYTRTDWHGLVTRHFLHHLLMIGAPNDVVLAVIEACPECLTWCDLSQKHSRWVALHYACMNGRCEENIKTILDAYPEASKMLSKGIRGRLPLHLYLHYVRRPSDNILRELLRAYPQSALENVLDPKGHNLIKLLCQKWGKLFHESPRRSRQGLVLQCIAQIHHVLRIRHELMLCSYSSDDETYGESNEMQSPPEFLPLHIASKDGGFIDMWLLPSEPIQRTVESIRGECDILFNFIEENASHVAITDNEGNNPLHLVANCTFKRSFHTDVQFRKDSPVDAGVRVVRCMHLGAIDTLLMLDNTLASVPDAKGRYPLHIGARSKMSWAFGLKLIWEHSPAVLKKRDPTNLLYPFMAAAVGTDADLDTIFEMLLVAPELVFSSSCALRKADAGFVNGR